MSTVRVNNEGVDVVEVKMSATGSNRIHFTAKDNILNADLAYVFGCCDLNVDCSGLGIFPGDLAATFVMRIRRRVANFPAATAEHNVFDLDKTNPTRQFNDTLSFMSQLAYWGSEQFSLEQDILGTAGPEAVVADALGDAGRKYLVVSYDVGGRIKITGPSEFWNNYVIELSQWAAKVLQLEDYTDDNNRISLTRFTDPVTGVVSIRHDKLYNLDGTPTAGAILDSASIIGRVTVLQLLDHRYFLEVHTHLPIEKSIRVHDGVETTDMAIIRVPFTQYTESTLTSEDNSLAQSMFLTSKGYVGRVNFTNKAGTIRKWTTLRSAYEQRIFRFDLFCVYNTFVGGKFVQKRFEVPFDDNGFWDLTVRFVSKI